MDRSLPIAAGALLLAACAGDEPVPAPELSSVTPAALCIPQSELTSDVTITGAYLDQPITVHLDEQGGSRFSKSLTASDDGTTGTFTLGRGEGAPASAEPPKRYDVSIEDDQGRTAAWSGTFSLYTSAGASSITPTEGSGAVTLTVTGSGFYDDVGVTLDVSPAPLAEVEVTSSNEILVGLDLTGVPAGTYDLVVTSPGGCPETLADAFTVTP